MVPTHRHAHGHRTLGDATVRFGGEGELAVKTKPGGRPRARSTRRQRVAYGFRAGAFFAGAGAGAMCAFAVSPIMCVVSPGAIFIESAIRVVVSAAMPALLFCAFLQAPAAMTTTATANAMRFMLSPVKGPVGRKRRRNVHRGPAQSSSGNL